ncbi:redoxin domain-containing protein [Thiocystis violacea]|uniref:redoxin domain-containing protein n=1 Tax=Thiocystis violacea TaxID=13725 RepID=UPI001908ECBF|nr:redoxin domain-containing protein [Thiocystis violacea]MBK1719912.1 thioredoxin family protein [Thiocystis violacea]
MRSFIRSAQSLSILALTVALAAGPAIAALRVGQPAPAFSVSDTSGKVWTLETLAGRPAILEWTNHDCPFVVKHYGAGNMQALQAEAKDAGYVWLSVVSSAPGKQGHVSPSEADDLTQRRSAVPTAVLLDSDGVMGRTYGAMTTPHMYVIDAGGTLAYMGGIDDRPTTNPADIQGATNHVRAAMTDLAAGQAVGTPLTRPYGCSVKY